MKTRKLIHHSLAVATTCLGLFLPPGDLHAGVAQPNANLIGWMDPEAWNWFPDHTQKTDPIRQIPQPGDQVFLSTTGGVEVTLSGTSTEVESVIIGAPGQNQQMNQFVLRLVEGAALRGEIFQIGRSGPQGPGGPGRLALGPGTQLDAQVIRLGSQAQNSGLSNNGFIELEGGALMIHTLFAGDAGSDEGSVISIQGSAGQFDISKNASFHGPDIEANAAGVTLEFIFDEKGVTPIIIHGDATFTAHPQVRIDLTELQPPNLPASVPLIQVSGHRSGETAAAEIIGLPGGQSAVLEWSGKDELLLKISK
jgi:hypothetical protein